MCSRAPFSCKFVTVLHFMACTVVVMMQAYCQRPDKLLAALPEPFDRFCLMHVPILAGEAEEEGYSDEYKLEDLEVTGGDYVKQEGVADFRSAWEEMDQSTELADSYGLGQRDSMQEAVEAVIAILGMQVAIFACMQLLYY